MAADVRKAFETNYPCHWQNLLGFVHQECRSLDDYAVEDVASEAILRVWQELIRLRPVDNLSGYLKTIAKNIVARRFRNERPDEVALSSDIVAPGFSPCETCERDEVSQLVAQAARSLPKSHRVALEYNQTGLSAREIAARLGCTENAARLLVQKGRRELARLLSRCGDSCALDDCRPSECPGKEKNLLCLKPLRVR